MAKEKKKRIQRGKVLRVSSEVQEALEPLRSEFNSWDETLRYLLQIPLKSGESTKREHFWVLPNLGLCCKTKAAAKGEALKAAFEARTTETEQPIKVVESM